MCVPRCRESPVEAHDRVLPACGTGSSGGKRGVAQPVPRDRAWKPQSSGGQLRQGSPGIHAKADRSAWGTSQRGTPFFSDRCAYIVRRRRRLFPVLPRSVLPTDFDSSSEWVWLPLTRRAAYRVPVPRKPRRPSQCGTGTIRPPKTVAAPGGNTNITAPSPIGRIGIEQATEGTGVVLNRSPIASSFAALL